MLKDDVVSVRESYFWGKEKNEITGSEKEEILSMLKTAVQKEGSDADGAAEKGSGDYTGFYDSVTGRRLSEEGKKIEEFWEGS